MNRTFWLRMLLILVGFVLIQGGIFLVLNLVGLAGQDYSSVLINAGFLIVCIVLIRVFRLSAEDVGLKIIKERLLWHVVVCLGLFFFYIAFYLIAMQISGFRPLSSKIFWGLVNYILVVFAEEIFFRGICYSVVEKRYSGRVALFVSAILFGLAHARQGLGMLPKFFTGFLWGTVRYTSGMIFLLIIPVHFAYNVVWLLFAGNWDNPPQWAQFFPVFELLLGLAIMGIYAWMTRRKKTALP